MAQNYASSIQGAVIRVTRLNADGTTATGASACYLMSSFISVGFTPNYQAGDTITQRAADGSICATFTGEDTFTDVSLSVAICNPDPEFTELVSGGTVLSTGGLAVGYRFPVGGAIANPNGVSIEVWSKAVSGGRQAAVNPYWHWVFPSARLHPAGQRTIENGLMANTFEGNGSGNAAFGDGPLGDWPFPSDSPVQYARSATAPTGTGYITVT